VAFHQPLLPSLFAVSDDSQSGVNKNGLKRFPLEVARQEGTGEGEAVPDQSF